MTQFKHRIPEGPPRVAPRVQVNAIATLTDGMSAPVIGHVGNISVSGVYLQTNGRMPVDAATWVHIDVIETAFRGMLRLPGLVVRHDDKGIGLRFTGPDSVTLGHLRTIIRSRQPV